MRAYFSNRPNLPILNDRLQNDTNSELRGTAAMAMRQIWFSQKACTEDILPIYISLL